MTAHVPTLFGLVMTLFRCAALLTVAPLFGVRTVPARVRLGLAVTVALAAFLGAGAPPFASWTRVDALVVGAAAETVRGLAAGLAARFFVDAAAGAGSVMSLSMGIGFGALIDPIHGAESNAISELLSFVALGIAIGLGLPREVIAWLSRSMIEAPPGATLDLPAYAGVVVADAVHATALAVRLAYPVLVAVTTGHLAFGLLNRVTPQIGMGNVGFAVAIIAGGGALFLVAPRVAALAADAARQAVAGG
ncbi:MAG: flagellar biosynthetic protein FliR [Pseudomonadota bacterium]